MAAAQHDSAWWREVANARFNPRYEFALLRPCGGTSALEKTFLADHADSDAIFESSPTRHSSRRTARGLPRAGEEKRCLPEQRHPQDGDDGNPAACRLWRTRCKT